MERTKETLVVADSCETTNSLACKQHRRAPQLRILAAFLLALLVVFAGKQSIGQQMSVQKLTLAQIEELVTHGVPDSTLGAQIERRGVDFVPTPALIESLRTKGAGPRTLAAILNARHSDAPRGNRTAEASVATRRAAMTRAQLDHLIHIHASDAFIAEQVQSRGISFPVSNAMLSSFTEEGAEERTVAELHGLVRTGSVKLLTNPQTSVSLDGNSAGESDATGVLVLQDVLPGTHTINLKKSGYQPAQQTFQLGDNEVKKLPVLLKWAGALLTISAQPPTAEIVVTGPVALSGGQNAAQCPPGAYTASVTQAGYLTQTRSFTLSAGEEHQEHVDLAIDPAFTAHAIADARNDLTTGNANAAARLANQVLGIDQANGPAIEILAESSFLIGDMQSFVQDARAAIRHGQAVAIPLMHLHTFPRQSLQRVNMIVSGTGISVRCIGEGKCDLPQFLSYDLIAGTSISNDPQSVPTLRILWTKHPHAFALHNLDFVPLGSQLAKAAPPPNAVFYVSKSFVQLPNNSVDQYRAIIALVGGVGQH